MTNFVFDTDGVQHPAEHVQLPSPTGRLTAVDDRYWNRRPDAVQGDAEYHMCDADYAALEARALAVSGNELVLDSFPVELQYEHQTEIRQDAGARYVLNASIQRMTGDIVMRRLLHDWERGVPAHRPQVLKTKEVARRAKRRAQNAARLRTKHAR